MKVAQVDPAPEGLQGGVSSIGPLGDLPVQNGFVDQLIFLPHHNKAINSLYRDFFNKTYNTLLLKKNILFFVFTPLY